MHTLDHALLDCFYATRLLKTGGYLVLDDLTKDAVRKMSNYLSAYPCYERVRSVGQKRPSSIKRRLAQTIFGFIPQKQRAKILHPDLERRIFEKVETRMLALKKIGPDKRGWDWYCGEF
jgi:hypothetical protein